MIIKRMCKTDNYKDVCMVIKIHIHDIGTIFSLLLNAMTTRQACEGL